MQQKKPHILVVDDDDRLRALLQKFLTEQDFLVTTVASTKEARSVLQQGTFDAMVLDVMMPGETGLQLLEGMNGPQRPPVLMLSAMGEADDRIRGLEVGADDYLAKPFEPKELVLRIGAIMRRKKAAGDSGQVAFGGYSFDMQTGQLQKDGQSVAITSGEIGMLKLLAQHAGAPVSREALAATLPGLVSERSVDVHITRLRKKIEGDNDGRPLYLQTVRGKGYVLYVQQPQAGDNE